MKKKNLIFAIILLFALCISCKKNSESEAGIYSNKTVTWLENDRNYTNKQHIDFLRPILKQLISEEYTYKT